MESHKEQSGNQIVTTSVTVRALKRHPRLRHSAWTGFNMPLQKPKRRTLACNDDGSTVAAAPTLAGETDRLTWSPGNLHL